MTVRLSTVVKACLASIADAAGCEQPPRRVRCPSIHETGWRTEAYSFGFADYQVDLQSGSYVANYKQHPWCLQIQTGMKHQGRGVLTQNMQQIQGVKPLLQDERSISPKQGLGF